MRTRRRLPKRGRAAGQSPAGRALSLLQDNEVHYNGEPVEWSSPNTWSRPIEAAARIKISYAEREAELDFHARQGWRLR